MRLEYKYLFPLEKLPDLKSVIMQYCHYDKFCLTREERFYTVRSIYLDSDNLNYYNEKIDGIKVRKKIRIRGYNELNGNDQIFLEIKRKYNNFIDKDRALMHYKDLDALYESRDIDNLVLEPNGVSRSKEGARKFFFHVFRNSLRPVILVAYKRYAFYSKFNAGLRVTIDFDLQSRAFPGLDTLFEREGFNPFLHDKAILEVKFQRGIPHWFQILSKDFKLMRLALSKYTIAIDTDKRTFGFPERRRPSLSNLNYRVNGSEKSND